MFRYIQDEYTAIHQTVLPNLADWELIPCLPNNRIMPQQIPGLNNCGIYTCIVMEFLLNGIDICLLTDQQLNWDLELNGRSAIFLAIKNNKPLFQSWYTPQNYQRPRHIHVPLRIGPLFPQPFSRPTESMIRSWEQKTIAVNDDYRYVEEVECSSFIAKTIYTNKELDDLVPLPSPQQFRFNPPQLQDGVTWNYDSNKRIVTADFRAVAIMDWEHKNYVSLLMERDDITLLVEGLISPIRDSLSYVKELSREMGNDHYNMFRVFDRIKKGKTYIYKERTDDHISMRPSDFVKYLSIMQSNNPERPFSYENENGEEVSFTKANSVIFYMLDVDISRHLPSLSTGLNSNFKLKEMIPSGEWCCHNCVSITNN